MAEKKITAAKAPKTTKKTEAKKTTKKPNLHDLSVKDLEKNLAEKTNDLLGYKRSHQSGELVNPKTLNQTRKDIARIKTVLNIKAKENKEAK